MAAKYDMQIDLSMDCAQTRAIRLVGEGSSVLELGCATGYVSRVLIEQRHCDVVGIERNREAAAEARRAGAEVIEADLDNLDYGEALGERRFDVVLCGDVLEHLRDPPRALSALRPFLRPGGRVVASIPNVVHASVIAELLEGRFRYRPWGLLDDTHLRFFTRDGIYKCFEGAGFEIEHLERLIVEPSQTEFRTDIAALPEPLARALLAGEESRTYQFILTARPVPRAAVPGPHPEETATHPRPVQASKKRSERGAASDGKLAAVLARVAYLRGEQDLLARELAESRETVARQERHRKLLDDQALARHHELERLYGEHAAGVRDVEWLHREVGARDEALRRREQEADAREAEVRRLHGDVGARDQELARLHEEVARRDRRVEVLAGELESVRSRLAVAEDELRDVAALPLVRLSQWLRRRLGGGVGPT